jgi:hypothetical protein
LITKVELRIDEDEDEAVTKLTSEVEGMDEDKGVPDLATEVELRMDEDKGVPELATEVELRTDEDEAVPKLLTAEVEFKLDVELGLKFRSAA